jgi:hypothetical protein
MNKWCQECVDLKKQRKMKVEDMEAQTRQNELLQESLRRLTGQRAATILAEQDPLEVVTSPDLSLVYTEVKRLSQIYLENYVSSNSHTLNRETIEESLDQWTWIYRIMLMPEYLLRSILFQFGDKQSRANYRRLCIAVHPDKNPHELASKAFQKIIHVYGRQ